MGKLLKQEGLASLVKLIFAFEKQLGKKKVMEMAKSNPGFLLELVDDTAVIDKGKKDISSKGEIVGKWTKADAKSHLSSYKLSNVQRALLEVMISSDNKATLSELEKGCKDKGIKVNTGSVIGGSLAGLSKKSASYGLPEIYEASQGKSGEKEYNIVPEALEFVEEYLN